MSDDRPVEPRLLDALCTVFGDQYRATIGRQTGMDDIPEWDSLSFVKAIISIEKAFGVRFTADESAQMTRVATIAEILTRKTGQAV